MSNSYFYLILLAIAIASCTPNQKSPEIESIPNMTDDQIQELADTIHFQSPKWSPDGSWLLYQARSGKANALLRHDLNTDQIDTLWLAEQWACCANISRDGNYIAFTSTDGDLELYLMDKDGQNLKQLTDNNFHDGGAQWAHNEPSLMLTSVADGDFAKAGIYTINIDGSDKKRRHPIEFRAYDPSWSHSGEYFVAQHVNNQQVDLYRFEINGSNRIQLTTSDSSDWYAEWSPDDQKIAWRNNESGAWDIYLMDMDGNNKQNLTESSSNDRNPNWSPDGQQIAYQSQKPEEEKFHIWLMDADGNNKRQLTQDGFDNQSPKWGPDGKQILYTAKVNGYNQVMIINSDGSGKRIISHK